MRFLNFGVFFFLAGVFFLGSSHVSFSAGDPSECVITIKSVQLEKDSGEWITVVEPDRQVDLISQEATISFFNNGRRVPSGHYKNFKIMISKIVKVKGADGNNKTRAGGFSVIHSAAVDASELQGKPLSVKESSPTWTDDSADQGRVTFELDLNKEKRNEDIQIVGREDFAQPLSVTEHSFINVWFELNLSGTLHYSGSETWGSENVPVKAMVFLPPKQVDQVTVVVDDQKITVLGQNIRILF